MALSKKLVTFKLAYIFFLVISQCAALDIVIVKKIHLDITKLFFGVAFSQKPIVYNQTLLVGHQARFARDPL